MAPQGQRRSRASNTAAIALALSISMAAAPSLARSAHPQPEAACLAWDLHILTLIEDHGLVEDTEPEVLSEAATAMLKARVACRTGDVKQALALYESIPLDHVRMSSFYRILMR